MKFPFSQKRNGSTLMREFNHKVNSEELVWHRDRQDRLVSIVSGTGWSLQMENRLPVELFPGETYHIPRNTYHRVIKGTNNLVVEIKEVSKMKITRKQLRKMLVEIIDGKLPSAEQQVFDEGYNDAHMGMAPSDPFDDVYMAGYDKGSMESEKEKYLPPPKSIPPKVRESTSLPLEIISIEKDDQYPDSHLSQAGRSFDYGQSKSDSQEGRMTRAKLFRMAKMSQSLHDKLEDGDDLPDWVQDKVTTAEDRLSSAHDYMEYKIHRSKLKKQSFRGEKSLEELVFDE